MLSVSRLLNGVTGDYEEADPSRVYEPPTVGENPTRSSPPA
jgi:hypothetical protein